MELPSAIGLSIIPKSYQMKSTYGSSKSYTRHLYTLQLAYKWFWLRFRHSRFMWSDFVLDPMDASGSVSAVMWKLWRSRQLWNSRLTAKQRRISWSQKMGWPHRGLS